ncbi:MAG TPA: hypothetical protein VGC45_15675 [Gryllotalpicola sp.]
MIGDLVYPPYIRPNHNHYCPNTHVDRVTGEPRRLETTRDSDLCGICHGRYPHLLRSLAETMPALADAVTRLKTQRYDADRVQQSGVKDVTSSWNPAALSTIRRIDEYAGELIRTITHDAPNGCVVTDTMPRPAALTAIATWHARWLSHYPTKGPEWLEQAYQLLSRATRALDTTTPRYKRIVLPDSATCQDPITETPYGPVRCGGRLTAIIPTGDEEQRPSEILCTLDPDHTRLDPMDWFGALS